jgi:flavin reductase (DIM6/NTAB) family NADH-FMN oxidoreductase RutF
MKKNIGSLNVLYPTPTVLVGTEVNGKINYIAIAHIGIIDHNTISLSMGKNHFSNIGIRENKTLSINIPSEEMVIETDFMGIASGFKTDKSKVFESFYGEVKGAPMIKNVPLSMECEVVDILDHPTHDIFLVKSINTYCEEDYLTNGKVDISKIKPILFDMRQGKYWGIGKEIGDCWSIGRNYKNNI